MTDADQLVVWLREAMDAEADLAQRVAARHTASRDERVPEEQRGKPFWPLAGARHRYEEFAPGKKWSDPDLYAGLTLIETYSPQRVLRRIAADRKMLDDLLAEKHYVLEDSWYRCSASDRAGDRNGNEKCDCGRDSRVQRHVRLLAEGWGWTEEATP